MKIERIRIEKLFELFDYDISLSNNANLLIITGPNGFGKTMILNIIFNLFNRKFHFFQNLVFTEIAIYFDNSVEIVINRESIENRLQVIFTLYGNKEKISSFEYSAKLETDLMKNIARYIPIGRVNENEWIDHRSGKRLSTDEFLYEYADQLPEEVGRTIQPISPKEFNVIFDAIKVHLIREQRLFRKVQSSDRNYREEKDQTVMIETIQTYAKELKQTISQASQSSFIISQQLDSSYPDRLVQEKNVLTEEEYNSRFEKLKLKQEKLAKNGLYENKRQFLGYSKEDSKALLVYLNDLEQKLSVFDNLLEKLELFTDILNERRFTYKSIHINREKGFYFKTVIGKELELTQLSSGEQHEVVLLYELIFNAKENTLVLIDEPEISLHITWQKEFLNDLLKIILIQNIQVLIASHSPSIINDRWDLVYNLEKEDHNEEN